MLRPRIMKLHRYIDFDWLMTPIDFQVARSKVKVTVTVFKAVERFRPSWASCLVIVVKTCSNEHNEKCNIQFTEQTLWGTRNTHTYQYKNVLKVCKTQRKGQIIKVYEHTYYNNQTHLRRFSLWWLLWIMYFIFHLLGFAHRNRFLFFNQAVLKIIIHRSLPNLHVPSLQKPTTGWTHSEGFKPTAFSYCCQNVQSKGVIYNLLNIHCEVQGTNKETH